MKVKSEDQTDYLVSRQIKSESDDAIIKQARMIIIDRLDNQNKAFESPAIVGEYLQVLLAGLEHEVFAMISLDNRNRPIAYTELFRGTVDVCAIYPREAVKQALADNAAAVIFSHNHPSGITEPSQADIRITERLKNALALVDIRVLDHVIVGESITYFSERGLI